MKTINTLMNNLINEVHFISKVQNRNVIELTSRYIEQYDLKVMSVESITKELNDRFKGRVIEFNCQLDHGSYSVLGKFLGITSLGIHLKGIRSYTYDRSSDKVNQIKSLHNIKSISCRLSTQVELDNQLSSLKLVNNGKKGIRYSNRALG